MRVKNAMGVVALTIIVLMGGGLPEARGGPIVPPPAELPDAFQFIDIYGDTITTEIDPPPGLIERPQLVGFEGGEPLEYYVDPPPDLIERPQLVGLEGGEPLEYYVDPPPNLIERPQLVGLEGGEPLVDNVEPPTDDLRDPYPYLGWIINEFGDVDYTFDGTTTVPEEEGTSPDTPRLAGIYPNPFNPETSINFTLARAADRVLVTVHDPGGRLLRILYDGPLGADLHVLRWDGRNDAGVGQPSGVYLFSVNADGLRVSGQGTLLK